MSTYYTWCESPVDTLLLTSDGTSLTGLYLDPENGRGRIGSDWRLDDCAAPFPVCARQLTAYFCGELTEFDLPLHVAGTEFQRRVWAALRTISYGATTSYSGIAKQIGSPAAVRAVGLANGCNPIPIIIPCHRVIGADGSLTGYGGGLQRKRVLLELESRYREAHR